MPQQPPQAEEPQFIDEHHQAFVSFADSYLDEEEREEFIDSLMERHGYVRQQSWGPPEPQGGGQGGGGRQSLLKPRPAGGGGQGGGRRGRSPYFKG